MGKRLPVLSAADIVKALSKVGFAVIPSRGEGSHIFTYRQDPAKGITNPNVKEVRRGTLRSIIREAGLTVDEFLLLL